MLHLEYFICSKVDFLLYSTVIRQIQAIIISDVSLGNSSMATHIDPFIVYVFQQLVVCEKGHK